MARDIYRLFTIAKVVDVLINAGPWGGRGSRMNYLRDKAIGWPGLTLFGAVIAGAAAFAIYLAMHKGLGWLGVALVVVTTPVVTIAMLQTAGRPTQPETAERGNRRRLWIAGAASLSAALAVIGGLAALDSPPPKTDPRILREIKGFWGRPGCRDVFHFQLRGSALIIDYVRRPPGVPATRLIATITHAEGDKIDSRGGRWNGDEEAPARFTYWTDGVRERLDWEDSKEGSRTLHLYPCGKG